MLTGYTLPRTPCGTYPYLELPDLRPTSVIAGYHFSFALTVDDLVPLPDLRKPA